MSRRYILSLFAVILVVCCYPPSCESQNLPAARDPNTNGSINPRINGSINPKINGSINPKINGSINPKISESLKGKYVFDTGGRFEGMLVWVDEHTMLWFGDEMEWRDYAIQTMMAASTSST